MERFEEISERYNALGKDLTYECMKYIRETLEKLPEKTIDFDEDVYCFSIDYDGGNHPEYNSNCFSTVERAYLKDGDIYLDTCDCTEYSFYKLSPLEKLDVATGVKFMIEKDCDIE